MDCALPLFTYVAIAVIVLMAAFNAAGSWNWPIIGYAAIGFICLVVLCVIELSFLSWLLVVLPLLAILAIFIFINIWRWYEKKVAVNRAVCSSGSCGHTCYKVHKQSIPPFIADTTCGCNQKCNDCTNS